MVMRRRLSLLIGLYIGAALFLLALVLGFALHQGIRTFLEGALQDKAEALARQLATVSLDAILVKDYGTLERYAEDLVRQRDVSFISIERADGEVLGLAQNEDAGAGHVRLERVVEPVRLLGNPVGQVMVEYDAGRADLLVIKLTLAGFLGILAVVLPVFLIVRRLVQRRLIAPIQSLARSVNPRGTEPLPSIEGQPEEIAQLIEEFARQRLAIDAYIQELEQANQITRATTQRLCQEQRLATIGQLAAGLAHGLNTPLANILGYAQMAERESSEERTRERMAVVQKHARVCSDIVRNLLTSARREPVGQWFDPVGLLGDLEQLLRPMLHQHGVGELSVEGASGSRVWGDPAALEHVLFNLIANAAHAGCDRIRIRFRCEGGEALLQVEDNGPGISEDLRNTLFQPFITSKPAGEGTGLGLYMCRNLLRAMGGEIHLVQSTFGSTVFQLRLPTQPPANPKTSEESAA